jgi:hypothetical protein
MSPETKLLISLTEIVDAMLAQKGQQESMTLKGETFHVGTVRMGLLVAKMMVHKNG